MPFQIAAVIVVILGFVSVAAAQRESIQLNSGWRFICQDVALTAPVSGWDSVNVPHTWNAEDGWPDRTKSSAAKEGYYRGACWYERNLEAPEKWRGKRVFIRFEAAALEAKVYLNGRLLGEHRGGFTAFCYELTEYLKFGRANELRVRVDNSPKEDIPPFTGDFNINGGLYRSVWLIVTDEICITPLDFASTGVYLTTKSVEQSRATVEVKSLVSNGGTT